ncbi:hypothetical protein K439DRAFT_1661726 [Ramaria rubella]|nr:hypothetical protein K439DRAFT_1661726 [Ramaria rubella]
MPNIPTPALVRSVAEAAHYSSIRRSRAGDRARASFGRGILDESLSSERKRVLADIKEALLALTYKDPLSDCHSLKEYAPQWFALRKIFPKSETLAFHVLSSTDEPKRMVCSQRQQYTLRFFGTKKVINSLIVIDLDDNDKIIKLEDKWNGEEQPTRWGTGMLRRLNAKTLSWIVHVEMPKDKGA